MHSNDFIALLVLEAILVIEMEEVLVAKIQFSGANLINFFK